MHFAAPLPEVVPQPDRTYADAEAQVGEGKSEDEFSYPPTSPIKTSQQEVSDDEMTKGQPAPAGAAPQGSGQPVVLDEAPGAGTKRTNEPSGGEAAASPTKKQALPSPTVMKRAPEIPAEALDPRVQPDPGGDEENPEGGVLQVSQVFTHVDEASPELPEQSYIHLEEDVSLNTGLEDHPDTWTDEKWVAESLKGKAKGLSRLKHYGVYVAVQREERHDPMGRNPQVQEWKVGHKVPVCCP